MRYKASHDKLGIGITIAVTILLTVLFFVILKCFPGDNSEIVIRILVLTFFVLVPVITFLFSPTGYSIDETEIRIIRPLKSISIKYVDIIDVSIPDDKLMKKSVRSGGVGGLFGYYGNFYNKIFGGDMIWYATQLKKFVIIKTKKDKKESVGLYSKKIKVIIVTPDKNPEFVDELEMKLRLQDHLPANQNKLNEV
jgi:hypothetical protein